MRWKSFPMVLAATVLVACSNGSSSGENNGSGGSAGASGAPATDSGISVDPFNGDCTTAKWANVSDACWQCLCGACADTLDACNENCFGILECASDQGCLVNQAADIGCEIQCTAQTCLTDPASQAEAQPLTSFDACLIGMSNKDAGAFRACEDVCQINYTGDTCTRFPP